MTKEYCDVCGREIYRDLFLDDRKVIVRSEGIGVQLEPLVLCNECNRSMLYFLQNPVLLKKCVCDMSFANRVRFLFGRRLGAEHE